jgi:hypothetical protein
MSRVDWQYPHLVYLHLLSHVDEPFSRQGRYFGTI